MQKSPLGLALGVAAALLAGCSGSGPTTHPSYDPLKALQNPHSPAFIDKNVHAILHEHGKGPATFTIPKPQAPEVRFWVACAPDSRVTVTMGGSFREECGTSVGGSGSIPVKDEKSAGKTLTVQVKIPAGVNYWIVGIPYDSKHPDTN